MVPGSKSGMNKTRIVNVVALVGAALAGGFLLPHISSNAHAEIDGLQTKYEVVVQQSDTDLAKQLNEHAARGWKLVQAVPANNNQGIDLIFSKIAER